MKVGQREMKKHKEVIEEDLNASFKIEGKNIKDKCSLYLI